MHAPITCFYDSDNFARSIIHSKGCDIGDHFVRAAALNLCSQESQGKTRIIIVYHDFTVPQTANFRDVELHDIIHIGM